MEEFIIVTRRGFEAVLLDLLTTGIDFQAYFYTTLLVNIFLSKLTTSDLLLLLKQIGL